MSNRGVCRFIADEIIKSCAANSVAAICDRLSHTETHGNEEQAIIAGILKEYLEEEVGT